MFGQQPRCTKTSPISCNGCDSKTARVAIRVSRPNYARLSLLTEPYAGTRIRLILWGSYLPAITFEARLDRRLNFLPARHQFQQQEGHPRIVLARIKSSYKNDTKQKYHDQVIELGNPRELSKYAVDKIFKKRNSWQKSAIMDNTYWHLDPSRSNQMTSLRDSRGYWLPNSPD